MNTKNPDSYNYHSQYTSGWSDGAGSRSINEGRSILVNHAKLAKAYMDGYKAGQTARRNANAESAARYGFTEQKIVAKVAQILHKQTK